MIIAVDFDGTLVTDKFPFVGEPKWDVINKIKEMKNKGNKIILWTCRNGYYLKEAIKACKEFGLTFDAINDDIPEVIAEWKDDRSKKITADFYIDDKSLELSSLTRIKL